MKIPENDQKIIDNLKIGKLVKTFITIILEKELISENEIESLLKRDYSKLTFNVIYPILRKVDYTIPLKENRIINGNPRYYSKPIKFKKTEYFLTNEWKEFHREDFLNWLKRKVKDL